MSRNNKDPQHSGLSILPHLLLVLAALFWAGNFIAGRSVHHTTTPLTLAFWRWFLALLILLPFGYPLLRDKKAVILKNWSKILILACSGIAGYSVLIYTALQHTTALNAALLLSIIPVIILLMSTIFYQYRITWSQVIGIVLSFLGALFIISKGSMVQVLDFQVNSGDFWMMAALPIWALYTIQLQRFTGDLKPLGLLTATVFVGVILLTPFYLWELFSGGELPHSLENIGAILYISLAATVGAFFFWTKGVTAIGANKAALFIHLVPVFAAVLAILLLKEKFQLFHGLGMGLVFTGIFISSTRK